jgi:hypothetical protein
VQNVAILVTLAGKIVCIRRAAPPMTPASCGSPLASAIENFFARCGVRRLARPTTDILRKSFERPGQGFLSAKPMSRADFFKSLLSRKFAPLPSFQPRHAKG